MSVFVYFDRDETTTLRAGVTVSRKLKLPKGDFKITEYIWGTVSLWFVDKDRFTADERQEAYLRFISSVSATSFPNRRVSDERPKPE